MECIQGKLDVVFEDAGEQRLKNIIRPVRVYRVRPGAGVPTQRPALPMPEKPYIAGQLIDAATGAHLWADRFDCTLEDIFDVQEHMSASIVGAIAPKLEQAEMEHARRKPTESLDAYDYYLRGRVSFHRGNKKAITEALELFNKAIQLDPGFGSAYGMAAVLPA